MLALSPDDGEATVVSSPGAATETKGVPSSRQKLRFGSVKVFLHVGQLFIQITNLKRQL